MLLFAYGFESAKSLVYRIRKIFIEAKEHLSRQTHYDFDMRDFVSLVNYAGPMKIKSYAEDVIAPTEDQIICRALRDINLPKLVQEDVPFFKHLINDYFSCPESKNIDPKLSESIK